MKPAELRNARDAVLKYVYEHGADAPYFNVDGTSVMADLRLSGEQFSEVFMLMLSQGLISDHTMGGCIGLSERGQAEAERLGPATMMRESTDSRSITINNSGYGIVQVAGANAVQTATIHADHSALSQVLDHIEEALPSLRLTPERFTEARGLVQGLRQDGTQSLPDAVKRATGAALAGLLRSAGSDLWQRLVHLLGISLG